MAALSVREDQANGQLILKPPIMARIVRLIGNLVWVIVFVVFFLASSFEGGRVNPESAIIFLIILLFSLGPSIGGFLVPSVKIDRAQRTVSRTTRLLFVPIRSIALSFNDLANIEVQYYRSSSRQFYRVNAIDRAGSRMPLNWDGGRDEIFSLAQKISAMTGAPLLDHSERSTPPPEQVIEMAKNLGLPVPQVTSTTPDAQSTMTEAPSEKPAVIDVTPAEPSSSIYEPMPSSVTPATIEEAVPLARQDLRRLSVSELEQRVASDPMDSDARYALASNYHASGRLDRATELYQATLQIDTSNAEAQNDLGVALQQRGKRTEAEAAYRRAIALDPFSFAAHLNLALLLRSMNRAAEASQEFYQARQSARDEKERQVAESASGGAKLEPRLSA